MYYINAFDDDIHNNMIIYWYIGVGLYFFSLAGRSLTAEKPWRAPGRTTDNTALSVVVRPTAVVFDIILCTRVCLYFILEYNIYSAERYLTRYHSPHDRSPLTARRQDGYNNDDNDNECFYSSIITKSRPKSSRLAQNNFLNAPLYKYCVRYSDILIHTLFV